MGIPGAACGGVVLNPQIVTEFIEGQISGIVAQIRKPKTQDPQKEQAELLGELGYWMEEDRKRRADWTACL